MTIEELQQQLLAYIATKISEMKSDIFNTPTALNKVRYAEFERQKLANYFGLMTITHSTFREFLHEQAAQIGAEKDMLIEELRIDSIDDLDKSTIVNGLYSLTGAASGLLIVVNKLGASGYVENITQTIVSKSGINFREINLVNLPVNYPPFTAMITDKNISGFTANKITKINDPKINYGVPIATASTILNTLISAGMSLVGLNLLTPVTGVNLQGLNLSGIVIGTNGLDISSVSFYQSNLTNGLLAGSTFTSCIFSSCDFTSATISYCHFYNCHFAETEFSSMRMEGVIVFNGCGFTSPIDKFITANPDNQTQVVIDGTVWTYQDDGINTPAWVIGGSGTGTGSDTDTTGTGTGTDSYTTGEPESSTTV